MPRIITVTSGKGGAGKTSISLNLALELARQGMRVCLFDADLGMANINILTGIYPEENLSAVIEGRLKIDEIMIRNYQGVDIIPGSSGIEKITNLTTEESDNLILSFLSLSDYDFFIFDTSAGISEQVISFCLSSHEIVLVITTEPTSLTDAYSLLKILSGRGYQKSTRVIVNQVTSAKTAQNAYIQLKDTVHKFLPLKIKPLGVVAFDKNVRISVVSQTPFTLLFPDSKASRCIQAIGKRMLSDTVHTAIPLEIFWDRCLSLLSPGKQTDKLNKSVAQKKAPDPQPMPEQKPEIKTDSNQHLYEMIEKIETGMSALMEELLAVKKIISLNKQTIEAEPEPEAVSPAPMEISLDFESWLSDHKRVQSLN